MRAFYQNEPVAIVDREARYPRLYITYLRQKLERDPAHPKYILTERGKGYRFRELDADESGEPSLKRRGAGSR